MLQLGYEKFSVPQLRTFLMETVKILRSNPELCNESMLAALNSETNTLRDILKPGNWINVDTLDLLLIYMTRAFKTNILIYDQDKLQVPQTSYIGFVPSWPCVGAMWNGTHYNAFIPIRACDLVDKVMQIGKRLGNGGSDIDIEMSPAEAVETIQSFCNWCEIVIGAQNKNHLVCNNDGCKSVIHEGCLKRSLTKQIFDQLQSSTIIHCPSCHQKNVVHKSGKKAWFAFLV